MTFWQELVVNMAPIVVIVLGIYIGVAFAHKDWKWPWR